MQEPCQQLYMQLSCQKFLAQIRIIRV